MEKKSCTNKQCGLFAEHNHLIQNCAYVWENGPQNDCAKYQTAEVSPSNSSGLLCCPFCEGTAKILAACGDRWVRCSECGATSDTKHTGGAVIELWNKRAI